MTISIAYSYVGGEQIGPHTAERNIGTAELAEAEASLTAFLNSKRYTLRATALVPGKDGHRAVKLTATSRF